jgi:hypothetical protein
MPTEAMFAGALARFGQIDGVQWPHAHPSRSAVEHKAEHPVLCAVIGDAEIKSAAVAVHAGRFRLVHLERRELANRPRHYSSAWALSNKYVYKYNADYDERPRTCQRQKYHGSRLKTGFFGL